MCVLEISFFLNCVSPHSGRRRGGCRRRRRDTEAERCPGSWNSASLETITYAPVVCLCAYFELLAYVVCVVCMCSVIAC